MRRLAVVVVLAASSDALAGPFDDGAWRVVPSVLVGLERFDYHESVPAPLQSKHDGTLPTAQIAAELRAPHDRWYGRASFGLTDGSLTYVGSDQQGDPITGPTTGYMSDTEAVIGWRGHAIDPLWIGAYAGLGRRTWRRDLSPSPGGYLEDYAWGYVPLGVTFDSMPSSRAHVAFDAALLVPFDGSLRAHLSQVDPSYSDLDIVLVNQLGVRVRLATSIELTRELHALASVSFETTSVTQGPQTPVLINGQQATDPNGNPLGASEPDTRTYRTTLAVGVEYAF
jgi:hypothetical protein